MSAASVAGPGDEKSDVFIRRITLRNLLSFGPEQTDLELGPLNVLIGPNGSGKSNLIAAIGILRAAPRDIAAPISDSGGIGEWLHKWESGDRKGSIGVEVDCPPRHLRYSLFIEEQNHQVQVYAELVGENAPANGSHLYYHYERGVGTLHPREGARRVLAVGDLDRRQSVLSQLKDPHAFPEITDLGKRFDRIRIYREWSFGRRTPSRGPQPSDLPQRLPGRGREQPGPGSEQAAQDARGQEAPSESGPQALRWVDGLRRHRGRGHRPGVPGGKRHHRAGHATVRRHPAVSVSAGHLVSRRPAAVRVHRGAGAGPASGHHADACRPAPRGVHSLSIARYDPLGRSRGRR